MELIIFRDAREAGRLRLSEGTFSIGRGLHNTIALDDQSISRRHARLHVSNGHVIIQDLGSINGTLLNGSRVREAEVDEGDSLVIGPFTIEVRLAEEDVVYHDGLDSTSPGSRPDPVRVSAPVSASAAPPPPPKVTAKHDSSEDEGMHPHDFLGLGEEDWSENVPTTPLPSPPPPKAAGQTPKPVPTRSRSSVKIDPSALTRRPDGRLSLTPRPKPPSPITSVDSADFIFETDGSGDHEEDDIFPQMPTEATTILRLPNTVDLAGDGSDHAPVTHDHGGSEGDPEIPFLQIPPGMARQASFPLGRRTFYIGRAEEADIVLLDANASRRHASIAWEDGAYVVKDLWSLNGILVNEARVTSARLHSGDRVRVGDTIMTFVWKGEPAGDHPAPAAMAAVAGAAQLPPPPHPRTTPAIPARPSPASGGLDNTAHGKAAAVAKPSSAPVIPSLPQVTQADLNRPETNLLSIGKVSASPALSSAGKVSASGAQALPKTVSAPAPTGFRHAPALAAGVGVAILTFAVLFMTRTDPEPVSAGGTSTAVTQVAPQPEVSAAFVSTAPGALRPAAGGDTAGLGSPSTATSPSAASAAAPTLRPPSPLPQGGTAELPGTRASEPIPPQPQALEGTGAKTGRAAPVAGAKLAGPPTGVSPEKSSPPSAQAKPADQPDKLGKKPPEPALAVASKPPKGAKPAPQDSALPAAAGSNDLERRMANQYQAGQAASRQGKLQEAIRLFQRALQEDPDRTSELYYQIEEDIETTRSRLNEQVRPLVAEARSLAEAGQLVEAHQRLQEAIARAPEYQPAAATLKQIQTELDRQGNRLLSSAQAKEQAGNKAEAQGLYRQVLSLFPDRAHPMHQKAAARLEKLSN